MKALSLALSLLLLGAACSSAQDQPSPPASTAALDEEQELLELSRQKWLWMAEQKADTLATLFHEEAMFVHMGGTMPREMELGVIRSGGIHYKQADIHQASARIVGSTAVVLNTITLLAVVGGNEVTNPFEVTEVYVRESDQWKLLTLSFTRLLRAP